MDSDRRKVYYYETGDGSCPYTEWRDSLRDPIFLEAWEKRLLRIRLGLLGNCKQVGAGVLELIFDIGPGYRVYIAEWGRKVVVLLCGGDKSTQDRDIRLAKRYWEDFRRSNS